MKHNNVVDIACSADWLLEILGKGWPQQYVYTVTLGFALSKHASACIEISVFPVDTHVHIHIKLSILLKIPLD